MWIVRLALRRPYTFVVMSVAILLLGVVVHHHDADRHFSLHRHPRRQRRLELRRHVAFGDGEPHSHGLRAGHDHHGQRHRAHRVAILLRRVGGPRLFSAQRKDRHGDVPDLGHRERRDARHAAGNFPAQRTQVRRVQRAHPPIGPGKQNVERAGNLRLGAELHPDSAGNGSGRRRAGPVRRQTAPGGGGSRSECALRQAVIADRRLQRVQPSRT